MSLLRKRRDAYPTVDSMMFATLFRAVDGGEGLDEVVRKGRSFEEERF